jgi:hypothetical protein
VSDVCESVVCLVCMSVCVVWASVCVFVVSL